MLNYDRVPVDYMRAGVERYIEFGILTGSFLTALFSNDLKYAFRCADENNAAAMHDWVRFMKSEMPHNSQGSEAEVRAWKAAGGLAGMRAATASDPKPEAESNQQRKAGM